MKNNLINLLVILIFAISGFPASGQNYCPNPGFEQLSGCPSGSGELTLASPWINAGVASDLFSFCHVNSTPAGCNNVGVPINFAGNTTAHGGSAYAGFFTKHLLSNYRSYVEAPLTSPMVTGQLYKVAAYFKRSGNSRYATNKFGISFSTAMLSQAGNQNIPVIPQLEYKNYIADTSLWTSYTGYYNAAGGEAYITIGNFRNDAQTGSVIFSFSNVPCAIMDTSAYYFVDDMSVTKITEVLNVTGDTLICTGQLTVLTGITNTNGWWSLASLPADTLASLNNVITISPAVTTSYIWHGIQSSYTATVSVTSPPIVSLQNDTTVCEGTLVTLNGTGTGLTYLWSTGDTSAIISVTDSGRYVLTVNNGSCTAKDTFNLAVIPTPEINLGAPAIFCANNSIFPELDAGPGLTYLWSPTNDTTQHIIVHTEGNYSVVVTHGSGCTREATIIITETCPETIYIPDAFTPNGDGKNDLFYGSGTNVFNYHIKIFNRWGQLLFETASLGLAGAWDGKFNGKSAIQGTYPYIVTYDGLKANGKRKAQRKTGTLVLIK